MALSDGKGFNSLDDVVRYAHCAKCGTKPRGIRCETDMSRDCRIFFIECHGSEHRVEISYLEFISLPRHKLMERLIFPDDRDVTGEEFVVEVDPGRPGGDVAMGVSIRAVENAYERQRDKLLEEMKNQALEDLRLSLQLEQRVPSLLRGGRNGAGSALAAQTELLKRCAYADQLHAYQARVVQLEREARRRQDLFSSKSETLAEAALRLREATTNNTQERQRYEQPLEENIEMDDRGRVIYRMRGVAYTLSDIASNFSRIHDLIAGMRCDQFLVSEEVHEAVIYLIEKVFQTGMSLLGFEKKPNWSACGPVAWRNIGIHNVAKYKKSEPYRLDMSSVPFVYYNKNNTGMDIYPDWLSTDEVRRQRVSGMTQGGALDNQSGPSRKIVIED